MKILKIVLSLAVSGMGVALATPIGGVFPRQALRGPEGQGALHLLYPSGVFAGCLEYHGLITTDVDNCWKSFAADTSSDGKSAAFADGAGPCTFYPFTDNSQNYTCDSRSIAPDYQLSTFQVSSPSNRPSHIYEHGVECPASPPHCDQRATLKNGLVG